MNRFDRLSALARQALDLARWHALETGHHEIDTGDLAWALLHQTEGGAVLVLARLRVPGQQAPPGWGSRAGDPARPGVTTVVADAIRHAFEEAHLAGAGQVGTEHLLLGLLDADPEAAALLGSRMMTADLVRSQVRQWKRVERWPSRGLGVPRIPETGPELNSILRRAVRAAVRADEENVQLGHVVSVISEATQLRLAAMVLDRLGGPARPPRAAMALIWRLEDLQRRKEEARRAGDDNLVERLTGEETPLQGEVYRALAAWHAGLYGPESDAPGGAAAPH